MTNRPIWKPAYITIGGWAGLWNNVYGEQYAQIDSQNVRRGFAHSLDGGGRFAYNQVIKAFITGDVGTLAFAPNRYIRAQDPNDMMSLGGYRPTIQYNHINRNVTAADQNSILQDLSYSNSPPWPVDKGGNGGGGKVGL